MKLKKTLLDMMQSLGVELPREGDLEDTKRALLDLRRELVVEYVHVAEMGRMAELGQASAKTPEAKAFRKQLFAELARPNGRRRGRKARRNGARRNPLNKEQAQKAIEWADGTQSGELPFLGGRGAQNQNWAHGSMEALFPTEGQLKQPDTWSVKQRFPQALEVFDLVTRAGDPEPFTGDESFSNKKALEYIVDAAGVSLKAAKQILAEMKKSAKGRKGRQYAMPASTARCKMGRARKLNAYKLPAGVPTTNTVVILVSPRGQQPRVMTWREGAHLDCDLVGRPRLQMAGEALQSALLWLAEKPHRLKKTRIYLGEVGQGQLSLVWQPGMPVSLAAARSQLLKSEITRYASGAADVTAYGRAMKGQYGALQAPTPKKKAPRAPRVPRRRGEPSPPKLPGEAAEADATEATEVAEEVEPEAKWGSVRAAFPGSFGR